MLISKLYPFNLPTELSLIHYTFNQQDAIYHYLMIAIYVLLKFYLWMDYEYLGSLVSVSRSVMPDSLGPYGLQPTRLLYPWDFPGKDTGVGCHFFLQGIFPIQGSNPGLPHCRQTLYSLSHQGSHWIDNIYNFIVSTKHYKNAVHVIWEGCMDFKVQNSVVFSKCLCC